MANDDRTYAKWLRQQPCAQCGVNSGVQLHHSTARRGIGQRSSDRDGIPLCVFCHSNFHSAVGAFRDMNKAARRKWQDDQVRIHRERYFGVIAEAAQNHYQEPYTAPNVRTGDVLTFPDAWEEGPDEVF